MRYRLRSSSTRSCACFWAFSPLKLQAMMIHGPWSSLSVYGLAGSASTRLVASRLDQGVSARQIAVAWMPGLYAT